jgi:hypothetical protein
MPHTVHKRGGSRPFKIVNKETGRIVGSSRSRAKATMSARIRDQQSGHAGK